MVRVRTTPQRSCPIRKPRTKTRPNLGWVQTNHMKSIVYTAMEKTWSQLSSRVIRVMGLNPGPFTLDGTNTYLIGTGARRILLDTGEGIDGYVTNLSQVMAAHQVQGIQHILLTHHHHDHVGGIPSLTKAFGKVPVSKVPDNNDASNLGWNKVEDGQVFKTEGATLRAVKTPGHTDDHVAFHLEEENAIFSGDCVLGAGTAVFTDLDLYLKSLSRLVELDSQMIYPGHGPIVENAKDKIMFYMQHRKDREDQIVECLSKVPLPGLSPKGIVARIYVDTPDNLVLAAANNVVLHLNKLKKEGRARISGPMDDPLEEVWTTHIASSH